MNLSFLKNDNNIVTLVVIVFCIAVFSLITLIANSAQFGKIMPYTHDESHHVGPAYEAAFRKELFLRYSQNYTAPESVATSYSGVIDSLYIRMISFFSGRKPIIDDPEFVDPLLQWFIIVKRGVISILLLVFTFLLLRKIYLNAFLAGICALLFISSHLIKSGLIGFEVGLNGEMGLGIFFVFALFLYLEKFQMKSSWGIGALAGIIAPIKLPVMLLSPIILYSYKSWIAFVITSGLLMFGLFRSSFDFSVPLAAITSYDAYMEGGEKLNFVEILSQNFNYLSGNYVIFFPFFILGLFLTIKQINRINFWRYLLVGILFYKIMSTTTILASQGRFFFGFTGIYLIIVFIGINYIIKFISIRAQRGLNLFVQTVIALIFFTIFLSSFSTKNISRFNNSIINVYHFFKNERVFIHKAEQQILDILNNGKQVYIDQRIRANVFSEPYSNFKDQIHVVDIINDSDRIKVGSVLFTICYPPAYMKEYGLKSLGVLTDSNNQKCGKKPFPIRNLLEYQNHRIIPIRDRKNEDLLRISVDAPLCIKEYTLKEGEKLNIPVTFFKITGTYLQEWESRVTNRSSEFELSKRLEYESGLYEISGHFKSNYRKDSSRIIFYLDDNFVHSCNLNTTKNLFAYADGKDLKRKIDYWGLKLFGSFYGKWRNNYFPLDCTFTIKIDKPGIHEIKIKIKSDESEASLRFDSFDFENIKYN